MARSRSTCAVSRRSEERRWHEGAAALCAALRGDCHVHTDWRRTAARRSARWPRPPIEIGHDYVVITDHSPRLTVANGLTHGAARASSKRSRQLNAELAPFRILTGIEVDINEDGSLDQDPELLARLDVVVGSVHSELRMDERADDAANGDRAREPEPRHPRPLHGADEDGQATGHRRPSTRRSSSPPPRASTRRSR